MAEKQDLPAISPAQCRAARAMLGWTLDDLAGEAEVGRATIQRFESGEGAKPSTVTLLRNAFERRRIRFIDSGPHKGGLAPMRPA